MTPTEQPKEPRHLEGYNWTSNNRAKGFETIEAEIDYCESLGYRLVPPEYHIPNWAVAAELGDKRPKIYVLRIDGMDVVTTHFDCTASKLYYPVFFKVQPVNPAQNHPAKDAIILPFLDFGGDKYPIIKELKNGYKLIAHKNCVAICNGDHMSTLDQHDDDDEDLKDLKRLAFEKFQEWVWPLVLPRLEYPTYQKKG